MKSIEDYKKLESEYLEKQKYLAENSNDPVEREVAEHTYAILSGNETAESLANKEIERWKAYLLRERISTDSPLLCKKCGYTRYFYKEYAIENHICPGCNSEYAISNDDTRYSPNAIPKLERWLSLAIGIPLVIYSFAVTYLPSMYLILGGRRNADIFEFTGISKIPATLALLSATALVLSSAIDHYDKRNNEPLYKSIRVWTPIIYIISMFIAVVLEHEL
jgi:predicted Zn-ribbon and HTH transcriptional regulator